MRIIIEIEGAESKVVRTESDEKARQVTQEKGINAGAAPAGAAIGSIVETGSENDQLSFDAGPPDQTVMAGLANSELAPIASAQATKGKGINVGAAPTSWTSSQPKDYSLPAIADGGEADLGLGSGSMRPVADDLTEILGIGPKVAHLLRSNDIDSFAQLAATEVVILQKLLHAAKLFTINPASWPGQASVAAAAK